MTDIPDLIKQARELSAKALEGHVSERRNAEYARFACNNLLALADECERLQNELDEYRDTGNRLMLRHGEVVDERNALRAETEALWKVVDAARNMRDEIEAAHSNDPYACSNSSVEPFETALAALPPRKDP